MHSAHRLVLALFVFALAACAETDLKGPFFVTQPSQSTPSDEAYEYDAHAAGFVNPINWELEMAPAGMTVDNEGVVSWTPTLVDLGTHSVELSVTDGETKVRQTWDLDVHQDLLLGVTYSPIGHTSSILDEDEDAFFAGHDPWGRLIAFHSAWRDSLTDAGMIPAVGLLAQSARLEFGVQPAVGFAWSSADGTADLLSDGDGLDNSWSNQETRDEFLAMVTTYADLYEPQYLFLGNEINSWYWTDVAGWADWLSMLGECYDAIKATSPGTMVYTVFQLERLKGLGAGTIGWTDAPHWNLVDDVVATGKVDAIGFTSYPHYEYAAPADVPAGYYDEIAMHWTGPVVFTEIGWPGVAEAPYAGGTVQQQDFVNVFFAATTALDFEYACWLYLHDFDGQAGTPGFMDIGLRSNEGLTVRPADADWQAAVELRERP